MKKILSVLAFIAFTFYFLAFTSPVFAKDYSIESADFDVQINKDGSADVTETRVYNFDGSFSWADEWIPTKGYSILDIKILGADRLEVGPGPDKIYIKWYYTAINEQKTFTLKYKIQNAVTNHSDISEFYWQLIGDQWTKGVGMVSARVQLPYPALDDHIWAFGHGPLSGKINIISNQEVDFSATNLPANKFFEVRILFPTNPTFVNAQKGKSSLSSILVEEKGFGTRTKISQVWQIGLIGLIVVILIWRTLTWILRWYKIGKDDPLPEVNLAGTLHEPPSEMAAVYVETMLSGMASGKSIVATILELTRRKILAIDFIKDGKKSFWGNKDVYNLVLKKESYMDLVSPMERDLLEFLFNEGQTRLNFDEIKDFGKTRPSKTQSFWISWKENAKTELKKLGFYEQKSLDVQGRGIGELVGWGILTYLYFQFGIFFLIPQITPVLIVCVFVMALSVALMRKKSKWGGEEVAGWLAFKKWLKDYSVTKNYAIDSVILWEKYLVYGTVLGISVKALSQLPIRFSEAMQRSSGMYMAFYAGGDPSTSLRAIGFEKTFSTLSSSFNSYGAAGVGSSGGFSGGGGGGGGAG